MHEARGGGDKQTRDAAVAVGREIEERKAGRKCRADVELVRVRMWDGW